MNSRNDTQSAASRETKLKLEYLATSSLTPDPKNARKHSARQIAKLADIIGKFGWSSPIVIDEQGSVLAGNARLSAALRRGMIEVPCVRLSHLSAAEKKALAIADNAMTDASSFDDKVLRETLLELTEIDFDLEFTGLDMGVIDFVIDGPANDPPVDDADNISGPDRNLPATTRSGDLWLLGDHKLICGNALDENAYSRLLENDRAAMAFTDPPYNVPIHGHVSGLGRNQHREFAMASGEMSEVDFRSFLSGFMSQLRSFTVDGSIHYLCIDWSHIRTMLEAGDGTYTELKAICVWNKTNAGMGSLYRSKHELVVVYKNGSAAHVNNVALGKHGRHRSNMWDYAGANVFSKTRDSDLAAHPTVKPIGLVADAMRDCSNRGDIVLDPFMGSGTTIMAAERSGRRGFGIEIDEHYVDIAITRWEKATDKPATLQGDGRSFEEVKAARSSLPSISGGDA